MASYRRCGLNDPSNRARGSRGGRRPGEVGSGHGRFVVRQGRRATREQAIIYLPVESFLGTVRVAMARRCHQNHGL